MNIVLKKRCTGTGDNVDLSDRTSFLDDSSTLCEILSRLPVKSLARFKCVCKHWKFLIEDDSYFVDLHLKQSHKRPALCFVIPNRFLPGCKVPCGRDALYYGLKLLTVDLMVEDKERAVAAMSINTAREMEFPYENGGFFGPVNGLIGFHSKKYSGICICNVSTQEVSPWIKSSTVSRNVEGKEGTPHYEMGFDPATKKHKVICIWRIDDINTSGYLNDINTSGYNFLCEVLTVGDNNWRRIELPPFELGIERKHTVYLNGFIYYCTSTFMKAGELGSDKIVAFDVGAEKFTVITVPDSILDQPRLLYRNGTSCNQLIELEGRLSIVSNMSNYTAKLWVSDDVHWTEVTIILPFLWNARRSILFHSVAGKDQIVIESYDLYDNLFQLHLYNWKTKSCREMEIRGFKYNPSLPRISTLVESLFRVQ